MSTLTVSPVNGSTGGWHEANQRYLLLAMEEVRTALQSHRDQAARTTPARPESLATAERPGGATHGWDAGSEGDATVGAPALDVLATLFGLSTFERAVLVLCAAVELDSSFAGLCAVAQDDPRRSAPTFSLALAALPAPHWSAITPVAPLRHWRLLEVGPGEALTTSPLRIDERVLHYLAGIAYLGERLRGLVEPIRPPATDLPPSHRDLARQVTSHWSQRTRGNVPPLVELCGGGQQAEKRAIAAVAGAAVGMQVQVLSASDIPSIPAEREALARLWEREAALTGSALLVDCDEADSQSEALRAVTAFTASVQTMLLLSTREPLRLDHRPVVRLDVHRPSAAEQRNLWRAALGPLAESLNGHLDRVVGQFSLGPSVIEAASATVLDHARDRVETDVEQILWDACRLHARSRLDDLAQRIEPAATWEDLVLPEPQRQLLREVAAHVRQRTRVYETWGFGARGSRGLGISALFAGTSGTGKTMAAEVLANELRLELYRIDLASVVSKYIGETEKNLRRVFDAAEEGGAILLFDEADALFGKRSEVKDSHDRYANIEVSYLLQRMESYRGLAILTTNFKEALDPAFLRRLRFVVHFPFPDAEQRGHIWRRIFPAATPTEGLQVARLARLNVAGGNIRNIALNAAFLAADAGEPVRMAHVLRAAHGEYAKLERPLTDTEVGQGRWA